ncbi:MAG: hypothetical protein MI784_10600 [Cytophagales bacterium]|nr:hypothetical protein [Cytophagales bacterium]
MAQDNRGRKQTVEDAKFEIVKERKNRVGEAERRFEKIPPQSNLEVEKPRLEYLQKDFSVRLPDFKPYFRVLKIKKEKKEKILSNYVKAGLGNYYRTMAEVFVGGKQGRRMTWGLKGHSSFWFRGPKDKANSSEDLQQFRGVLNWTGSRAKIENSLSFKRRGLNYYGYREPEYYASNGGAFDENDIKQSYNDISYLGVVSNAKPSDWQYRFSLEPYFFNNSYDTKETGVLLNGVLNGDWGTEWGMKMGLELNYTNLNSLEKDESRAFLKLRPEAVVDFGDWTVTGGLAFVYQSDSVSAFSKAMLFPVLDLGYLLNDQFDFHFGLDGGATNNTFRSLSYKNPFISPVPLVQNSVQDYSLYGKVSASLLQGLQLRTGFDYSLQTSLPYFVNNFEGSKPEEFLVKYDDSQTQVFHFFIDADYLFQNSIHMGVQAHFNSYDSEDLEELWSYPTSRVLAFASFNAGKKVNVRMAGEMLGGIKAWHGPDNTETLDAIFDLELRGTYQVNKRISAFLNLDNILGQENSLYYRYPTRGFQFMLGAKYDF